MELKKSTDVLLPLAARRRRGETDRSTHAAVMAASAIQTQKPQDAKVSPQPGLQMGVGEPMAVVEQILCSETQEQEHAECLRVGHAAPLGHARERVLDDVDRCEWSAGLGRRLN